MNETQKLAFENIVNTYNGGERKLAGARASELVYGASKKPNQQILDALIEEIPGVREYISAPVSGVVTERIGQDASPQAVEVEEKNKSSEATKREQDKIDDALAPGREAREKALDGEPNPLGSTEVNPPEGKHVASNPDRAKK